MTVRKHKSALLITILLLLLAQEGRVGAAQGGDGLEHGAGSVHVVSQLIREAEEVLLMDGLLRFVYPHSFQVQYFSQEGPVIITSHAGFLEVQAGNDVQFSYERYWLFEDFTNYLFAFADYLRAPRKFSGVDLVAGVKVKRYISEADPELWLYVHEQSGLPFLIRQGKKTLVSVVSFILDAVEPDKITWVELELLFAREKATLQLELTEQGWVPTRLTVHEALGEVHTDFTGWSWGAQWQDSPFERLEELREFHDAFLERYEEGDWAAALQAAQTLAQLAPQSWQAYLYQAFVYDRLDNYLGAVENYQQVLMRQPDNPLALNNLAYHYLLKEVNISRALEMAERAVELDRKAIYLDTLGYGYYLVGRLEEARELLEEALASAPEEAVAEITEHLELVLASLGEEHD